MRTITIEPHNPHWFDAYEKEQVKLKDVLSDEVLSVHHIGSTSVPGLAAKPVIDILLEIKSLERLDNYNTILQQLGYTPRGENGISGRRYFIKGGDSRTHHIHAFESGSIHITRHLAFRDYLRRHTDIAQQYAAIKFKAAESCDHDSAIYCQLKSEFIHLHEKMAFEALALNVDQSLDAQGC
ncbi:GrpB family protein [Serratia aquatilis]|uniref:GrpB family protein n=1 Tax=Serratia aquatilis TaxID=1737515 RepID=A0ABV6EJP6_9GAMM